MKRSTLSLPRRAPAAVEEREQTVREAAQKMIDVLGDLPNDSVGQDWPELLLAWRELRVAMRVATKPRPPRAWWWGADGTPGIATLHKPQRLPDGWFCKPLVEPDED